jgi:hypothetical protein
MPRMIAAVLLMLTIAPVAGAFGGAGVGYERATTGCQVLSVLDGNTVELACPGHASAPHDVMGLQSPPVFGAHCLSEAWWGLRSRIALQTSIWRAQDLTFITEPRANLVLVFADGIPLHRVITPVPPNLCT